MKIYDTRDEYHNDRLVDPEDDPYQLFETWYAEACAKESHSPNAMSLITNDADQQPWCRTVLLKAVEDGAFVFFTNTTSPKAQHIGYSNRVCLHFYWKTLHRQVQIHGVATPISRAAAIAYFLTRPLESQLSSWVSEQSRPLSSREGLLSKLRALKDQLPSPMTAPQHWGGYQVSPSRIEFWQGAEHRLHHRVVFAGTTSRQAPTVFGRGTILSP